jgi:hypothetical protein
MSTKTPDQQVSETIAQTLVDDGLLEPKAAQDLIKKIVTSRQTASEWTLLFKAQIQDEAQGPLPEEQEP